MEFKKIYIEITNICNMNCPFCPPHNRKSEYMDLNDFEKVLNKIKPYTKYIYLHVKGEPMLHPQFDDFVKLAYDMGFFVNITTNGTLLKNHLSSTKYIRQLNISLHATNDEEIIKTAMQINNCYVNFRVWNTYKNNKDLLQNNNKTINLLEKNFGINIYSKLNQKMDEMKHCNLNSETNFTLKDNFYISIQNEFEWPNINKNKEENGYCHALKDHIAILVNGTIVPCCLDNNGDIELGNIFDQTIDDVLESEKAQRIIKGFSERKCVERLCQNCEYKNRF